jgi:SAM-dependent methyltransferase
VTSPTDVTLTAYQDRADAYVAASPGAVAEPVAALLDVLAAHVGRGEVLELGSGPGLEANYLERRGVTVHRTDATPAFVERLKHYGHAARVVDVRCGDFGGPFDALLANAVLLHLSRADMAQALLACCAATRPGGVFALTLKEGDGEAWSDAKLGKPRWFVYWREEPLRHALQSAGWSVLQLERVQGRLEPWLHVVCRRNAT